jgi:hypothetical protein
MADFDKDTVHLVRLALEGKVDDVAALARRMLRAVAARRPDLASVVQGVMEAASGTFAAKSRFVVSHGLFSSVSAAPGLAERRQRVASVFSGVERGREARRI